MTEVLDFMRNALPWIAIGLFVAVSCVKMKAKKDGKESGKMLNGVSWFPALIFLYLAIADMLSGNKSSGTTWLVLSVFNAVVNFSNIQNNENME